MKFRTTFNPTPNISARQIEPKGIILHHTAGTYQGSVSWCLNRQSQVSYHYIIDTNGNLTKLAHHNQRTWHAGISTHKGRSNCNDFMIGIAVSGDTTKRELKPAEIESMATLCVEIMKEFKIDISDVVSHRHVSPRRKVDLSQREHDKVIARIKELI